MRRKLAIAAVVSLVVAGAGLSVLLFLGGPVTDTPVWVVTFVVTLLALIGGVIMGVFAIILPLFGRSVSATQLAAAAAEGREGLARVLSATPTGSQINGAYVYDAVLVVDQTRVPAYKVTDRIRVNRLDGLLRGGEILSVVRLRDDAPQVAVVAGPARTPQDALVPQDAPPWA